MKITLIAILVFFFCWLPSAHAQPMDENTYASAAREGFSLILRGEAGEMPAMNFYVLLPNGQAGAGLWVRLNIRGDGDKYAQAEKRFTLAQRATDALYTEAEYSDTVYDERKYADFFINKEQYRTTVGAISERTQQMTRHSQFGANYLALRNVGVFLSLEPLLALDRCTVLYWPLFDASQRLIAQQVVDNIMATMLSKTRMTLEASVSSIEAVSKETDKMRGATRALDNATQNQLPVLLGHYADLAILLQNSYEQIQRRINVESTDSNHSSLSGRIPHNLATARLDMEKQLQAAQQQIARCITTAQEPNFTIVSTYYICLQTCLALDCAQAAYQQIAINNTLSVQERGFANFSVKLLANAYWQASIRSLKIYYRMSEAFSLLAKLQNDGADAHSLQQVSNACQRSIRLIQSLAEEINHHRAGE